MTTFGFFAGSAGGPLSIGGTVMSRRVAKMRDGVRRSPFFSEASADAGCAACLFALIGLPAGLRSNSFTGVNVMAIAAASWGTGNAGQRESKAGDEGAVAPTQRSEEAGTGATSFHAPRSFSDANARP
ncbi:hypothetical protein [Paraburkholderia caballeronis]|uniref:hypothetical protein n=1 Tax=Paraburkholderia caballeronis TaxID=416943 RepID=UPI0010659ACD|nr:hypothetical protein [Paraburkholderia caballeronis]